MAFLFGAKSSWDEKNATRAFGMTQFFETIRNVVRRAVCSKAVENMLGKAVVSSGNDMLNKLFIQVASILPSSSVLKSVREEKEVSAV